MSSSGRNPERTWRATNGRLWIWKAVLGILAALAMFAVLWFWWVVRSIEAFATVDQAAPADAIAVFGAAEYAGKPSPIFRARLEHARNLYERGIAPLIVTLGGDGGDQFSEGQVGRDYLMGTGIPDSAIIAETQSTSTSESAKRLAVIARTNDLKRIVLVSDGMHMFRLHAICAGDGLNVLSSPRPHAPNEDGAHSTDSLVHEALSYTLWRLHLD